MKTNVKSALIALDSLSHNIVKLAIGSGTSIADNVPDTEFIGYDSLYCKAIIASLVEDKLEIMVFYIFQRGTVHKGVVEVGKEVEATVNVKLRQRAQVHHTATHLLQAAMLMSLGKRVIVLSCHIHQQNYFSQKSTNPVVLSQICGLRLKSWMQIVSITFNPLSHFPFIFTYFLPLNSPKLPLTSDHTNLRPLYISFNPPSLFTLPNNTITDSTNLPPLTSTPFGSPCGCAFPMKVKLTLDVAPYAVFPVMSELEYEVALGTYLEQSQVKIMGATADVQNQGRTIVDINLVPLGEKFDNTTEALTYESENADGSLPVSANFASKNQKTNLRTIIIIALSSFVLLLVLVGVFSVTLKWRKSRRPSSAVGPAFTSSLNKRSGLGSVLSSNITSSTSVSLMSAMPTSILSIKTFSLSEIEKATPFSHQIPSPTQSPNMFNQNFAFSSFHSSSESQEENDSGSGSGSGSGSVSTASISVDQQVNTVNGGEENVNSDASGKQTSTHEDSDLQECLEHNLPDSPFASPTKAIGDYMAAFNNGPNEAIDSDASASSANSKFSTHTVSDRGFG
ncbi:hypothetical protein RYX36_033579 [Vicia faba]